MKTTKKDILIFCFVLAAIPIFLYRNILVYYLLVAIDLAPVPHVLYDEIFGVNSYDRASIKKWILEKPIHGDVSLIKAKKADKMGNLIYSKSARNCNPIMATAGKIVIAQVDEIVEIGEIDPEHIITPGVFIDYLVLNK